MKWNQMLYSQFPYLRLQLYAYIQSHSFMLVGIFTQQLEGCWKASKLGISTLIFLIMILVNSLGLRCHCEYQQNSVGIELDVIYTESKDSINHLKHHQSSCHLTYKIATPETISLSPFTRNQSPKWIAWEWDGRISLPQVDSGTIILPKKYCVFALKMCFPAVFFPSKRTWVLVEPCRTELIG